jgi:hypothetical protein
MQGVSVPHISEDTYNQSLYGYFGELGKSHFGVRYLQTALNVGDIDKISLVSEIPDSEKWKIRELFQRDIQSRRVDTEIIPYFKKATKIKFFNPLTIALLPVGETQTILHGVQEETSKDKKYMDDRETLVLEAKGYYRIHVPAECPQWSRVQWQSKKVKLIALDGQHRLCALKRIYREYLRDSKDPELINVEFSSWTIPIVLIIFPPTKETADYLLTNMRDIFVTINKEAQKPNRCRQILLDDDSVTSICCQELLDTCHEKSPELPLLFFDWRAHDDFRSNPHPQHPAPFMRVEELEDIHINYLIGSDDDEQEQLTNLWVSDMEEPLSENEAEKFMQIRERYRQIIMPATIYLLNNFSPLVAYITFLKNLPKACVSPIQKHALSRLEYGQDYGTDEQRVQIDQEYKNLTDDCETNKAKIPALYQNLIGLRAFFSGFQGFMDSYKDSMKKILSPLDAAKLYVQHMNKAYKDGLLKLDCPHLIWVCIDPKDDSIIHYKFAAQDSALGAYCSLLSCVYHSRDKFAEPITRYIDTLEDTIRKGYRKQVRPEIKDKNPKASLAQLKELTNAAAEKKTEKHMKALREALEIDATA